jgi:DNA-binding MltR family transcriptional regulator
MATNAQTVTPSADFKKLVSEMFAQSDRASAVVAAAVLDQLLERCLIQFLRHDKRGKDWLFGVYKPLSSLKAKTDLAHLLGVITEEERVELDIVRQVRNDFAHKFDTLTFKDAKVQQLCGRLKALDNVGIPPNMKFSPLDSFRFSVTTLAYRLDRLSQTLPRVNDFPALQEALNNHQLKLVG